MKRTRLELALLLTACAACGGGTPPAAAANRASGAAGQASAPPPDAGAPGSPATGNEIATGSDTTTATPTRTTTTTTTTTATATATGTPTPGTTPSPSPRPTTVRLSAGIGGRAGAELAAGDDAFDNGDLAGAQAHYQAARAAAAAPPADARATGGPSLERSAAAVGLARVRIARVDVPLDYAAAKGNAEVAAAAGELARVANS